MFRNLKAEMVRKQITGKMIAEHLGINPATVSAKIRNSNRLTVEEAQKIRETFFPEFTFDYLFRIYTDEKEKK